MSDPTSSFTYLAGLFGVVTLGTFVPVLPSGAPLSAGAALAGKDSPFIIALVFVVGAAGAYAGDLLTYGVLVFATRNTTDKPGRLARWVNKERNSSAVKGVEGRFDKRPMRSLLLSRLVPGGRIPVLLTAALDDYAFARYAVADIAAAAVWSAYYTGSGLAGRALFSNEWEAVGASLALVLLVSVAGNLWTRWLNRRAGDPEPESAKPG
jgi:membrane protein DedA with SNARE-associated domain